MTRPRSSPRIDKLKETLKGTDTAAIKAATDELTQAFYAVSEKLYQQANPQGGAQPGPDMGGAAGRWKRTAAASTMTPTTRLWMTIRTTNSKSNRGTDGTGSIPRPIGTVLAENLSMRNRERSLQLPIPDVQVDS